MNEATLRQQKAASPHASTWLSANAGSGKTRVLTERVARLLLLGTSPQNILCLTYTKAAASEMQNRLFDMLGSWAMMGDADLRAALNKIAAPAAQDLDEARRLFAQAIETPGGLKIQTIHSFCASLLRRFPLEAGIAADFREMEEADRDRLMREVVRDLADGPELSALGKAVTADQLDKFLSAIAGKATGFQSPWDEAKARADLGIGGNVTPEALVADVFEGDWAGLILQVLKAMRQVEVPKAKIDKLAALDLGTEPSNALLSSFAAALCTKDSNFRTPTKNFLRADVRQLLGELAAEFDAIANRVGHAMGQLAALHDLDLARRAHAFGSLFVERYTAEKSSRGALDFDDLILKTEALLTSGAGQWVAFRLDGEIDHILVDEAQDTSPAQWRVIAALASELVSGQGARDVTRTIFVVGDQKQSIYSFQGADPAEFDRMRDDFAARLKAHAALETSELIHSFRSAPVILDVVDLTFANSAAALGHAATHLAFDTSRPGRVDLWPLVEKTDTDTETPAFEDPVDRLEPDHPVVQLAAMIAREVKRMIETETIPDREGGFRRIIPGDVMILLRRRSGLFHHIIRACKAEGVPIAGADRFKLGKELAVRDLISLMAFLSFSDDDLALAEVLRSPLCGLSEDDLFELAHGRGKKTLWRVLRDEESAFPQTRAMLMSLLNDAEFLRPYEMLERILTRHQGRAKLIGRLGEEARDGIDELLSQAIRYESLGPPSLTEFVQWVRAEAAEVKRGLDGSSGQVRVMTVHGAKGLESPVVLLPDTIRSSSEDQTPKLSEIGQTVAITGTSKTRSQAIAEAEDARKAAEEAERQRLLYVAMTRAEHWLVVCGATSVKRKDDDWHARVEMGVQASPSVPIQTPSGPGLRVQGGEWPDPLTAQEIPSVGHAGHLPDWVERVAPRAIEAHEILSPSDLGGAKWLPGEDTDGDGRAYGTLVHGLLEQANAVEDYDLLAGTLSPELSQDIRDRAVAEARAVLDDPEFSAIFGSDALAEVSVSAPLGDRVLRGQIDRLLVGEDRILIVDFKTNRTVPATVESVPDGLTAQLGAYAHALAALYPDRAIETAILWTATRKLQAIPHETVMSSLHRATTS